MISHSDFLSSFQMNMPLQNTQHPAPHLPAEIRYVPEEVMVQKVSGKHLQRKKRLRDLVVSGRAMTHSGPHFKRAWVRVDQKLQIKCFS